MKKQSHHQLKTMKEQNKQQVFNTIFEKGPISRINVSKQAALSPASVTAIVDELLEVGMVKEVGADSSTGGRRPTLLAVNSQSRYVIVFDLSSRQLTAGRVNMSLEIEETTSRVIASATPEKILQYILSIAETFKQSSGGAQLAAICLGVRSVERFQQTRVSLSTSLSSDFIPLAEAIQFSLNVPVIVERAANFAALGEAGSRDESQYYLELGDVIQLGGIPFVPEEHIAHMKVDRDGPLCSCGKRGCLTSFVSSQAVSERLRHVMDHLDTQPDWLAIGRQYVESSEHPVGNVLDDVSTYLGQGLVNIATVLHPDTFVLGGELAKMGQSFLKAVKKSVRKFGYFELEDMTIRLASKDVFTAHLVGGARTAYLNLFAPATL